MTNLVKSLGYNISGQFVARIVSFVINMYLLRVVDSAVIGLVNVRLMLLYDTTLFLTREPLRKSPILKQSIPKFVNIIWTSPLLCLALSSLTLPLWLAFSSSPVPLSILAAFSFSALLESLAEPFAVISLRFSLDAHFALSQALLVSLKRVIVLVFLFALPSMDHLTLFAIAQVAASLAYLLFHVAAFARYVSEGRAELAAAFPTMRDLFPRPQEGFDEGSVAAVRSLLCHSMLKQLLTDGSAFVMTFTRLLTLQEQAVYDAVERLGSLVARMILAPLEDSAFAYFSNSLNKESAVFQKNTDSHDSLVKTFGALLHDLTLCGLIVCLFGIPYSRLAVSIYGGELLVNSGGALLLAVYASYIVVTAVNGVTEAFAFASMNAKDVFAHGSFLFLAALVHLSLSVALCYYLGAVGFIIANMVNMAARIVYSWRHVSAYLGAKTPSIFSLLPRAQTAVHMVFALFACCVSLLLFGMTPGVSYTMTHLSIGAAFFFLIGWHVYHQEQLFQHFMHQKTH